MPGHVAAFGLLGPTTSLPEQYDNEPPLQRAVKASLSELSDCCRKVPGVSAFFQLPIPVRCRDRHEVGDQKLILHGAGLRPGSCVPVGDVEH